ncbi:MAG: hypothetical protein FJ295_13260 [Planctomycetes bacterium]|nr:hypothetical protein [Planctomycetota bacterium]
MDGLFWACNSAVALCVGLAAFAARTSYLEFLESVERDLADRLRSLRIQSSRLRSWINAWLAIAAAMLFGLWIGLDMPVLAVLLGLLLAATPWYIVYRLAKSRRQRIEDQLADALVMFSSGIRAGLSMAQALELLAQECPAPISQEFRQIVGEYNLGKPLERTLSEAKDRLRSENFVLFAAALLASRESGGRLNETVERISRSVVELQRLERKVRSETAQARKSAVYMALAPLFILAVYTFLDPNNVRLLFVTLPGQLILAVCVLLNLAAYLWALRILKADI